MMSWDNYSPRQIPSGQCVYSCKGCGALVANENIPTHDRWHRELASHSHHTLSVIGGPAPTPNSFT
jgi:hypothetical protein